MTRLHVVIPNWNGAGLLPRCLDALAAALRFRARPACVTVVDNASTDDSAGIARRHPVVDRLLVLRRNLGFAAAVNAGTCAEEGRAGSVLWLNTDVFLDPDALAALDEAAARAPEAGLLGPELRHPDGAPQRSGGGFWTPASALREHLHVTTLLRWLGRRAGPVEYVSGACLWVTAEAFRRIGPLDERFFFYGEDEDYARRARAAGFHPRVVPGARAVHLAGGSSRRRDAGAATVQLHRARRTLFAKYHARALPLYRMGEVAGLIPRVLKHEARARFLLQDDEARRLRTALRTVLREAVAGGKGWA